MTSNSPIPWRRASAAAAEPERLAQASKRGVLIQGDDAAVAGRSAVTPLKRWVATQISQSSEPALQSEPSHLPWMLFFIFMVWLPSLMVMSQVATTDSGLRASKR